MRACCHRSERERVRKREREREIEKEGKREREKEGEWGRVKEGERERVRKKERERELLFLLLKGMTDALAPFSYLVYKYKASLLV